VYHSIDRKETAAMRIRPPRHMPQASASAGRARSGQAAPTSPAVRFRVDFDDRCSVGVGKIRLLEAVERTGSLSQAARDVGMSYRRAWLLIDSMNAEFDTPVISATVGGSGGGGAKLTSFGGELIAAYRKLETRLARLTAQHMGGFAAHAIGRRGRAGAAGIRPHRTIAKPLRRASAHQPQKA
jgi:molybdate transport system regulatory protein